MTGPGRTHLSRVAVVAAGWVVSFLFLMAAPYVVLVIACCVAAFLACRESLDMWNVHGHERALVYTVMAATCLACAVYAVKGGGICALWAAFIVLLYIAACATIRRNPSFMLACLMPPLFVFSLTILRALPAGRTLVMITVASVWTGDIFAYLWGRHGKIKMHMLPAWVNPRKSFDAAVIGAVASAVVFAAMGIIYLGNYAPGEIIICAAAAGIAAQAGDLAESMVKRKAGTIDSGRLLGKQGGMLDAIDGLSFALPLVTVVLSFIH